jgi:hypothetical protein
MAGSATEASVCVFSFVLLCFRAVGPHSVRLLVSGLISGTYRYVFACGFG